MNETEKKILKSAAVFVLIVLLLMAIYFINCETNLFRKADGKLEYVATIELDELTDKHDYEYDMYNFEFFKSAEDTINHITRKDELSQEEINEIFSKLESLEYTYIILSKYKGNKLYLWQSDCGCDAGGYVGLWEKEREQSDRIYIYVTNCEYIPKIG